MRLESLLQSMVSGLIFLKRSRINFLKYAFKTVVELYDKKETPNYLQETVTSISWKELCLIRKRLGTTT